MKYLKHYHILFLLIFSLNPLKAGKDNSTSSSSCYEFYKERYRFGGYDSNISIEDCFNQQKQNEPERADEIDQELEDLKDQAKKYRQEREEEERVDRIRQTENRQDQTLTPPPVPENCSDGKNGNPTELRPGCKAPEEQEEIAYPNDIPNPVDAVAPLTRGQTEKQDNDKPIDLTVIESEIDSDENQESGFIPVDVVTPIATEQSESGDGDNNEKDLNLGTPTSNNIAFEETHEARNEPPYIEPPVETDTTPPPLQEMKPACLQAQEDFESTQENMYSIPLNNNPSYENLGDLEYARANTLKQIALLSALRQINEQYHQYLSELGSINQKLDSNYDDLMKDTDSLINTHKSAITNAKFYDDVLDILQIPDIKSPSDIKNYCRQPDLYQKCHLINKLENDHILLEITYAAQEELTGGSVTRNINKLRQALTQGLPNGVFDRQHLALKEMQASLDNNDQQDLKTAVRNASSRITSYEGNAKSVLSNLNYEFNHNQNLENYFKKHTSPDLGKTTSNIPQQIPYPQNAKDILKNHFASLAPNCETCQDDSLFDIFTKDNEGNLKLAPEKTRHFLSSLNDYMHQKGDNDLDNKISDLKSNLSYLTQEITKIHHKPSYLESLELNQQAYQQMLTHCGNQVDKSEGLNPVSCNQDVGLVDGSIEEIIRFGKDTIRGVIIDPSKKLRRQRASKGSDESNSPPRLTDSSTDQDNTPEEEHNSETRTPPIQAEVIRTPTSNDDQQDGSSSSPRAPKTPAYRSSREAQYLKQSCENGVWKGSPNNRKGDRDSRIERTGIRLEGCTKYNHLIPTATRFAINTVPVLTSSYKLNLPMQRFLGYQYKEQKAYNNHLNAVWSGNQFNQWNQNLLTSQFANPFGFSNPASMSQYGMIGASMMPGMVMPMTFGLGMINSGFLNTSLFIR